ncbi:MAG TPA: 4-hydroxythreonine-4-phosphate dehydrogenase PdxA [Verrucomicrobiae bacterium]
MKVKPIIGLTLGDPAGIGPEICLRALSAPEVLRVCVPVLFGDASVVRAVSQRLAAGQRRGVLPVPVLKVRDFHRRKKITGPYLVDCGAVAAEAVHAGTVSAACGRAGYVYIETAIQAALAGRIQAVVTAPIHKESLNLSGVKFPGHTEIFTALTRAKRSCMMLYSDKLTVSMATTHIGYHEVPKKLSVERIFNVIDLTAGTMRLMLQREPVIGVCGLNPHAGEHGLFGQGEEEKLVAPAVKLARQKGLNVAGPLVPDAVFTTSQRKKYDAIVTLYHDQGHIPFKMLAFDTGVNITLGLPIIRTSVDHGTAFDIAWQGRADATSLYSAIHTAVKLADGQAKGFTA